MRGNTEVIVINKRSDLMVVTSSVMFLLTLQEPGQQLGLADRPDAKECRPGGERHPPV